MKKEEQRIISLLQQGDSQAYKYIYDGLDNDKANVSSPDRGMYL